MGHFLKPKEAFLPALARLMIDDPLYGTDAAHGHLPRPGLDEELRAYEHGDQRELATEDGETGIPAPGLLEQNPRNRGRLAESARDRNRAVPLRRVLC
jgi:hypothetical protein